MLIKDKITIDEVTKKAIIMRDGMYQYLGKEIGLQDSMDEIFNVYRPSEEVKKANDRFNQIGKIPVTADHPDNFLNLKDSASYKNGHGENPQLTRQDDYDTLVCDLVLKDEVLKDYQNNVREISCGWDGYFEKTDNKDYSFIQRFRDINHIAVLPEGRCGDVCSIQDKKGVITMPNKIKDADEMKKEEEAKKAEAAKDADMSEEEKKKADAMKDDADEEGKKKADENKDEPSEIEMSPEKIIEFLKAAASDLGLGEIDEGKAKEFLGTYISKMQEGQDEDLSEEEKKKKEAETKDADEEKKKDVTDDEEEMEQKKSVTDKAVYKVIKDKALFDKAINDAFQKGKDVMENRFKEIIPLIHMNAMPLKDIKDKSPCQIKSAFVKQTTGQSFAVKDRGLGGAFKVALGLFNNPKYKEMKDTDVSTLESKLVEVAKR